MKSSLPKPIIVPLPTQCHCNSEVVFKYREGFAKMTRIWFSSYDDTFYEIYLSPYEAELFWEQLNRVSVVSFSDLLAIGFQLW